jgi:uncharacterized phage-associated protein
MPDKPRKPDTIAGTLGEGTTASTAYNSEYFQTLVASSPNYQTHASPTQTPERFMQATAGPIMAPDAVKARAGMAKAIEVAKYLVYLAASEEEPDYLSHLRLQKLLYYVQGWSLALRKKPMFKERIEAWAHGPVVRDVYSALSEFGDKPILLNAIGMPQNLTEEELAFIQSVWESYKQFSASSLRGMTHRESPWLDARKGLSPEERSENEITREVMKEFFTKISA